MGRAKKQIPAIGWRDEKPDITLGEHDAVVAVILMAWADAMVDLSKFRSKARYDEALAYKISAYRFLTEDKPSFPSRMSFDECCLALDLDVKATRKAVLATVTKPPTFEMPAKWAKELEDDRRDDVVYQTRRRRGVSARSESEMAKTPEITVSSPKKLISSISERLQDEGGIDFWVAVAEEIAKDG